ncbi:hypothetical protein PoB_004304200 [Plakobranchus ocellatus]|uniref:Uncharacterized protein n=1 Tax=Plakobranchus ocellatus TaxID=259542 RepID=A0AAV4BAS9_9GAST|nr:hypothetical protein PoB_004304200 [Plakobranchus ocellatus]
MNGRKCSVGGCKTSYKSSGQAVATDKIRVFSFPKGFFQQDNIEQHFASFRMAAGCNYFVTAVEIDQTHAVDRPKQMFEFDVDALQYGQEAAVYSSDLWQQT